MLGIKLAVMKVVPCPARRCACRCSD